MNYTLFDLFLNAYNGNSFAQLQIVQRFQPLLKKYAALLKYEDAYSDLQLYLLELLHSGKLTKLQRKDDGTLVKYIESSIRHQYISLNSRKNAVDNSVIASVDEIDFDQMSLSSNDEYPELLISDLHSVLQPSELTLLSQFVFKENLVDRSLLFITTDKHKNVHCLEVTFDIGNFLHMTGFKLRKSGINARHFFNLCYDKRLTEADFDFSADGTTEMKMRVLPSLMKKNLSAKMLGDYNMSQPKLYTDKIAGSLSACMGFVRDGGEGRFVPNTVLEGDIRTKVKAADRIIATYRKSRSEEQYSEIVFTAKKVEWEKIVLPDEYSYLVLPE